MVSSDSLLSTNTILLFSMLLAIGFEVTLEDFVDHIDHVCQLSGNSLHSAIGGDTDGQGGMVGAPKEVDTVVDYQKIINLLEKRGYKNSDIENIFYKNWQRFFAVNLP